MGLTPEFKLLANGGNITETIRERLISIRYSDAVGLEGDALEVRITDNDPDAPVELPPTGAELELFLGYDGKAERMGLFVVDEIELAFSPGEMTIRARAAPFEKSKGGKVNLQTQKTRSWPKGKTLGDVVKKIAGEHGLEAAVSQSLASIALPHLDQSEESDLHFLNRVAKKYDAVVKPAGGKLAVTKRGEGKSASGKDLPSVTLKPGDVTSGNATIAKRENSGTVVAYYHATKRAKRVEIKVGTGEPVTRLRAQHSTEALARAAAQSELDKRARAAAKLSLTLPGRADLVAETPLVLEGFRPGIAGKWITTRVEHELSGDGYSCSLEAETPNGGGQKSVTKSET